VVVILVKLLLSFGLGVILGVVWWRVG